MFEGTGVVLVSLLALLVTNPFTLAIQTEFDIALDPDLFASGTIVSHAVLNHALVRSPRPLPPLLDRHMSSAIRSLPLLASHKSRAPDKRPLVPWQLHAVINTTDDDVRWLPLLMNANATNDARYQEMGKKKQVIHLPAHPLSVLSVESNLQVRISPSPALSPSRVRHETAGS
ncbi:hypothetical protein LY78DRAFT_658099 [Colletotrichum sublineola]|nr:hypothetical protein LY78DRAFT_658099 [Colletotrichum sublineola]